MPSTMLRHLAILSAAVVACAGCTARPASKESVAPAPVGTPVRVDTARSEPIERSVELTASLKSSAEMELAPRVSARVIAVLVREGDRVAKGAELVRQDTLDLTSRKESAEAGVRQARASLASAKSTFSSAKTRLAQAKTQWELQQQGSAAAESDAEQQLQSAQAQLELAKTPQRSQEVAVAENAVAQAEANHEKAILDRKRSAQLVEEGAAARSQLDQAVTQERVSKAALETARAQLELIRTGGRAESVRQAEAARRRAEVSLQLAKANRRQDDVRRDEVRTAESAVNQAQSGVEQAQASLESARATLRQVLQDIRNTVLRAPADGIVSKRTVEVGQLAGPGSVLLTLVSGGRLFAEAVVPEVDIPLVQEGLESELTVDAVPGAVFPGSVASVYPSSDANRSYRVRIELEGANPAMRPGMFARCRIVLPKRTAVVVDKDALAKSDDGLDIVFVVSGGKAVRRSVRIGIVDSRVAEIVSGLEAGETVVVAGQSALTDGAEVSVGQPAGGKN